MTALDAFAAGVLRSSSDRIAARAQRRAQRRAAGASARKVLPAIRRGVLQAGGLVGLTLAAWGINVHLGEAIAGLSLFVFAWLLDG